MDDIWIFAKSRVPLHIGSSDVSIATLDRRLLLYCAIRGHDARTSWRNRYYKLITSFEFIKKEKKRQRRGIFCHDDLPALVAFGISSRTSSLHRPGSEMTPIRSLHTEANAKDPCEKKRRHRGARRDCSACMRERNAAVRECKCTSSRRSKIRQC